MNLFFKNMWMALAAVTLISCHGHQDDSLTPDQGNTPTPPVTDEVLSPGVMRIYADKTSIDANGADKVTFRVLLGTEDGNRVVSDGQSNMTIHYECDGEAKSLARFASTFTTAAVGAYTFSAEFFESGTTYLSENEVSVVAMPVADGGVKYRQHVMGVQFTSTGCTSCPNLTKAIKTYQETNPDCLLPVSFHQNMPGYPDPMTNSTGETFFRSFGGQGLPVFYTNMRKESKLTSEYSLLVSAVENELKNYPTTCGVAIESTYDSSTRKLNITGKVTSKTSMVYRYYVMLLEDGIVGDQTGDPNYVHNNVMRQGWPSDNTTGFYLKSDGSVSEPGVEMQVVRPEITLNSAWNADNMRIFFAVLSSQDGGASYTVDNCTTCKLGESVDYAYEDSSETNLTLTLSADNTSVTRGEEIHFQVVDGQEEEMTATATVVNLTTGERVEHGSYTPTKQGTYEFIAAYSGVVSNRITVTVAEGSNPNPSIPTGYTCYQRHFAIYEFTAVKCSFCPGGYSTLNGLINNPYGGYPTAHILAFHSTAMGDDPMATPLTAELENAFGNMSLPSIVIDLRDDRRGEINAIKTELTTWFDEAISEQPAYCGVAIESTYDSSTRKGTATVKVGVNEPGTYRVVVYVVENNINSPQLDNGNMKDNYNHHHVVRAMLSNAYTGDLAGKNLTTGDERTVEYAFNIDNAWDDSQIELYAIAIEEQSGHIKNLNHVVLGERADYDIYE